MKTTKHTFFCDDLADNILSEEESHHAVRVLRLKINDLITLIDGKGSTAICQISNLNKKQLSYIVLESTFEKDFEPKIHIGISPTKSNDRFEFFLEKVTELGIASITPLLCSNSERKKIKLDRLEKIVMSATKQSGILYIPKVKEMIKFNSFMNTPIPDCDCFIAHCEDDLAKIELRDVLKQKKNICILIGPEGDFTNEEIILAKENNFKPISLGKTRLRTETAGIVACHTVKLIL